MKSPHQLAGAHVPGAHVLSRAVGIVFLALRSGDDQVAVNRARRTHVIRHRREFFRDARAQIHHAFVAECRRPAFRSAALSAISLPSLVPAKIWAGALRIAGPEAQAPRALRRRLPSSYFQISLPVSASSATTVCCAVGVYSTLPITIGTASVAGSTRCGAARGPPSCRCRIARRASIWPTFLASIWRAESSAGRLRPGRKPTSRFWHRT